MTETCNGVDDDCDDVVDEPEDIEGVGEACHIANVFGECSRGTFVCRGSSTLACEGDIEATAELCDGLDNDCNGLIDDEPVDETLDADCETELPGQCTVGRLKCAGGKIECLNINPITPERCDGRDNDCDGEIDEGNPEGGGAACNTGLLGVCRDGARTCVDAEITCVQAVFPSLDSCGDHLDNDCDGVVDEIAETPACAHSPCVTGGALVGACDECVAQICAVDSFCCNFGWDGLCVGEVQSVCQCTCVL